MHGQNWSTALAAIVTGLTLAHAQTAGGEIAWAVAGFFLGVSFCVVLDRFVTEWRRVRS